jgi:hypothetical protein
LALTSLYCLGSGGYLAEFVTFFRETFMPKLKPLGQPYAGRRADAVVLNMTIDQSAAAVLRKYCPEGRKGLGRFIARLLYQYDAREQEAQQLHEKIQGVLGERMGL